MKSILNDKKKNKTDAAWATWNWYVVAGNLANRKVKSDEEIVFIFYFDAAEVY